MTRLSTFSPSFTAFKRGHGTNSVSQWSAIIRRTSRVLTQGDQNQHSLWNNTGTSRSLAQVRSEPFSELWFTAAFPTKKANHGKQTHRLAASTSGTGPSNGKDHKPPDERTLKLGKTLRSLSPLLPNILTTPLPNKLLSTNITLHLFPSTHPHLPVVRGRVPYQAALWTAPMAWGSVPIVGNVKLEIQSEKMVRTGFISAPTIQVGNDTEVMGEEKLVVRWRTEKKSNGGNKSSESVASTTGTSTSFSSASERGGVNRGLSKLLGGDQPLFKSNSTEPFTGLFVFSFDQQGKIASMTIEHADESHGCDKTSRMVTLTDWLLGRAKWARAKEEDVLVPGLAMNSDPYVRRFQWLTASRNHHKEN